MLVEVRLGLMGHLEWFGLREGAKEYRIPTKVLKKISGLLTGLFSTVLLKFKCHFQEAMMGQGTLLVIFSSRRA